MHQQNAFLPKRTKQVLLNNNHFPCSADNRRLVQNSLSAAVFCYTQRQLDILLWNHVYYCLPLRQRPTNIVTLSANRIISIPPQSSSCHLCYSRITPLQSIYNWRDGKHLSSCLPPKATVKMSLFIDLISTAVRWLVVFKEALPPSSFVNQAQRGSSRRSFSSPSVPPR